MKKVIKCGNCNKNPAPIHHKYGPVYCKNCNENLRKEAKGRLGGYPEFVPESTKEDRKKNFKSTLQPHRKGEPSKEYIEAYPEQAKKVFTSKERAKARNVWSDIPGHSTWKKSR